MGMVSQAVLRGFRASSCLTSPKAGIAQHHHRLSRALDRGRMSSRISKRYSHRHACAISVVLSLTGIGRVHHKATLVLDGDHRHAPPRTR